MHLYCSLHCNCSSVDSSLSELLYTFFVTTKEIVYFVYSLHTSLAFCIIPTKHLPSRYQLSTFVMAATRSGAPTTPAAASKATKATKTTRASKAKGGKKRAPKAANRVQKPAATGRNKGYVYINNDSRTETSSRTASPDFIPKTPPPSGRQRVVAESPPPSNQEYERKIARLQRKLRERR